MINKFKVALPSVKEWIKNLIKEHENYSSTVKSYGFSRLSQYFSDDLLERATIITLPQVPFPPIADYGLLELSNFINIEQMSGITFTDKIFFKERHNNESLSVHELVHVIQWDRLGMDNFLLAYGIGLAILGYDKSPLEQMAYQLQEGFGRGILMPNLAQIINKQTDALWEQIALYV